MDRAKQTLPPLPPRAVRGTYPSAAEYPVDGGRGNAPVVPPPGMVRQLVQRLRSAVAGLEGGSSDLCRMIENIGGSFDWGDGDPTIDKMLAGVDSPIIAELEQLLARMERVEAAIGAANRRLAETL
jgi:hypothetical protein